MPKGLPYVNAQILCKHASICPLMLAATACPHAESTSRCLLFLISFPYDTWRCSRGLEDYGSRIRRPMDLGTVLNKLKADQYHNPHMCRVDVIQVAIKLFACSAFVFLCVCVCVCVCVCSQDCGHDVQVWRNCLYYSGEKDDATFMAREVGEVFDCLFADRVLAPMLKQSSHTISTPQVLNIFLPLISRWANAY
jgi:hypothetical protein